MLVWQLAFSQLVLRRFLSLLPRRSTSRTEPISDGLSDDPVRDGHFTSSGPLSRCVLQCCPISVHLQCVTDLVHLPSQSVVCSSCNSQSPSSLDFLHYQHLCCVRHVEAPAGECMICSSLQSFASSFSLPCCRQRIHYECLAQSVHACGDHCPCCTRDLVPVLSDPLLAASFEHLDIPIDFNAPLANSSLNSVCVPDDMPHPPAIFPHVVPTVVDLLRTLGRPSDGMAHPPICPRFFL